MIAEGNILYFNNFQFNNGAEPKPKYFVIVKDLGDNIILGSLPTRNNKIPDFIDVEYGCVNKDDRCFNCFYFPKGKVICENGFSFPINTFIYGDLLELYNTESMKEKYKEGETYIIEGKLTKDIFNAIIQCFATSASVKNGFKRKLGFKM